MKLKACIAWTLGGSGARATSTVKIDASGSEILLGIEAIVTEAANALSDELKVPHDMARQAILKTLNENAGMEENES